MNTQFQVVYSHYFAQPRKEGAKIVYHTAILTKEVDLTIFPEKGMNFVDGPVTLEAYDILPCLDGPRFVVKCYNSRHENGPPIPHFWSEESEWVFKTQYFLCFQTLLQRGWSLKWKLSGPTNISTNPLLSTNPIL